MKTNNLKKQEEECSICGELGDHMHTGFPGKRMEGFIPPKVATSEKDLECKYYNKCPLKVRGEKCTHHDGGNISMNDGATSEKEVKYSDKTCECKGLENLHFEGQCQFYTSKKKKYAACDNLEAHIPDYNPKNYVPPHESEDWEKKIRQSFEYETLGEEFTNMVIGFIHQVESKAYQRGREEVQTTVGEWIDKNSWKEGAGNEVIQVEDLKKFISGVMKK